MHRRQYRKCVMYRTYCRGVGGRVGIPTTPLGRTHWKESVKDASLMYSTDAGGSSSPSIHPCLDVGVGPPQTYCVTYHRLQRAGRGGCLNGWARFDAWTPADGIDTARGGLGWSSAMTPTAEQTSCGYVSFCPVLSHDCIVGGRFVGDVQADVVVPMCRLEGPV